MAEFLEGAESREEMEARALLFLVPPVPFCVFHRELLRGFPESCEHCDKQWKQSRGL